MVADAFQDLIKGNHCFGCGPANSHGLRIKSYWLNDDETICHFTPQPHHCAAPLHYLNGGITSTLIDCHCICSAMARAYREEGRAVGEGEPLSFVTGSMSIVYRRPISMAAEVELRASFAEVSAKKIMLHCTVLSDGKLCAEGDVLAVRVKPDW